MKTILVQFTYPDTDLKVYEGIVKDLEAAGLGNIPERLYHVAAKHGDGWHVTDVWESEEAFNKFGETMIPLQIKMEALQPNQASFRYIILLSRNN